jgi:hypothetical protein
MNSTSSSSSSSDDPETLGVGDLHCKRKGDQLFDPFSAPKEAAHPFVGIVVLGARGVGVVVKRDGR